MNKAIFLDRDGVIDALVQHANGEFGAPLAPDQVRLLPGAADAIRRAAQAGWKIIVISNQPDAAKKKATLESLRAVHERLLELLNGAPVTEFFYCYHRSEDRCQCRKPGTKHVTDAARKYGIDLAHSWFVGDVDTDIETGKRAGTRTALLEYGDSGSRRGAQRPDWVCRDLDHFVRKLVDRPSSDAAQLED